MSKQHPITPPPELVHQWVADYWEEPVTEVDPAGGAFDLAARAAQWGADQELEACCECMTQWYRAQPFIKLEGCDPVPLLRAARRPKPLSLAEEALEALDYSLESKYELLRRALERLQELEGGNG